MDLQLSRYKATTYMGVSVNCVKNWAAGTPPTAKCLPLIVRFLGYDPRPVPETFGGKLAYFREGMGLTQRDLSRLIGVAKCSVLGWEHGKH